jgi:DNA-binding HxlR family transcriptional regulator
MTAIEKSEIPSVKRMIEDVVGCKWSLSVIEMVSRDVKRPGAMVREEDGLTTKVLNQRLVKLTRYGILEKKVFAEVPPRVEYGLTEFGQKFAQLLSQIDALQAQYFN